MRRLALAVPLLAIVPACTHAEKSTPAETEVDGRVSRGWPDSVIARRRKDRPSAGPEWLTGLPGLADGQGTAFERCIAKRVHEWSFPVSTGPTHVRSWGFASCADRPSGGLRSCLSARAAR